MTRLRRRVKRGACFVLVFYTIFLLLNASDWFDQTATTTTAGSHNAALPVPAGENHGVVLSKTDGGSDQGHANFAEGGGEGGGQNKGAADSVLLPEDLDLALQQQPEPRVIRKKLSQPHPQQVNVVVEDAPPGTFVKDTQPPDPPESVQVFEDLKDETRVNRRSQELQFENERERDVRFHSQTAVPGNVGRGDSNKKPKTEESPKADTNNGDVAVEDKSVAAPDEIQPDMLDQKNSNPGVWLSPDGSPDDLHADSNHNNLAESLQHLPATTNPWTPAPQLTVKMFNITVSEIAANFREIADVNIYSAFFDDRGKEAHVRMIAVGPLSRRASTSDLWCVFGGQQGMEPERVVFHQTVDCKKMKKYCFYMLACQVPKGAYFSPSNSANSVVVVMGKRENNFLNQSGERVRLDVIVNKKRSADHNDPLKKPDTPILFSVCVPPLFGKLNVLNFVEFVELNRLLGAVHFTFYKFRVSREIARVLTYYEEAGVASVLPWNLPAPNDVWYKGQSVAMGDCLYRNMHLFDFIAFHDLDEFFVPAAETTWQEMFDEMHAQSENVDTIAAVYHFFPILYYASPSVLTNGNKVGDYGGHSSEASKFLTLKQTFRASGPSSNLTKMFVKPERVLELDIHSMVKPASDSFVSYKVDPGVGSVHHYKYSTCSKTDGSSAAAAQDCDKLFENKTVWKYIDELVWRTKTVLQALNRFGTSFT